MDDILPGGGSPVQKRSSPARVIVSLIRRPSRLRSKIFYSLLAIGAILLFVLGRQNKLEIQRTASAVKTYTSNRFTDAIAQYRQFEDTRWDDEIAYRNRTSHVPAKPNFHLLIPSNVSSVNVCKTLLSAAVLKYPPPTLLSYGKGGVSDKPGADLVSNTLRFLNGKQASDGDLVLIVEEDSWFQLPAETTINRFLHGMRDSNFKLLTKYGRISPPNGTLPDALQPPMYTSKVLFGSTKECSNDPGDSACYYIPQSPLPQDIYGYETDKHPVGKYNRPRFVRSSMVMGRVADLRLIYERAAELLEVDDIGNFGSQRVFSQIFGEKEFARTLELKGKATRTDKWQAWLSSHLSGDPAIKPANMSLSPTRNHEFGIRLDYFSSVFQVMNNSVDEVRFVTFDHPSIIASPLRISAARFGNPINLPLDLTVSKPPYNQNKISSPHPMPPITALDDFIGANATWTDIALATNVIVPGSSVPATLNFHGSEDYLKDLWPQMWFYKNSRALMRQYIRSGDGPIAANAAAEGGRRWWNLRGGKGGVWTDREEWFEWNEVCGAYDAEVFGDGKVEFGKERVEVGGQKAIYNPFGELIRGKEGVNEEIQKEVQDEKKAEEPAAEPSSADAESVDKSEAKAAKEHNSENEKPSEDANTEAREPRVDDVTEREDVNVAAE